MRKAATAAFATTVFVVSVTAAPLASAAPAQDPVLPVECATLAVLVDPTCLVVEQVDGVLAPVADVTGEVLAPASSDGSDAPEPAPAPAPSSDARATSAAAPTAADLGSAPAQPSGAASRSGASSPRVPDVPAGSTLELGPLALPSFGLGGTPAVTGAQLAASAAAEGMDLPAARAAASIPDASKTTAVAMALTVLLLVCGLLIDQVRKARLPIQL